ncbi:MAG: tyrosine-type recombinase/integrase [candidate division WOR-3 bacterium]
MLLKDAINEFIVDRRSLGCKPATLQFYQARLRESMRFLEGRGVSEVEGITRSEVRALFAHLNEQVYEQRLKEATVAAHGRALRAFCAFCTAEGWMKDNPMKDRPQVKVPEELPDTLSLEEIARLLAVCGDDDLGIRDRALMLLMLDTGLRAGEVCALTLNDVVLNGDRGEVTVQARSSKNAKERTVPIWTKTVEVIRAWLEVRPSEAATLFVASDGKKLTVRPLTESGLNQMMRRRAKQAGVNGKRRWCHIWRHTFAKLYVLGNGRVSGDLETLRRLLGHKSLETVRIYLGFKSEDLEWRHWELSPVRRLLEKGMSK